MSTSIKIPFYKRTYTESEIEAVASCIRSGHMTQGSLVAEFEEKFAAYVGSKYAIAVNSCTSGLFLCLMLTKPKKVSIPSMTFASVASNILHAGADISWRDESWVGHRYAMFPDDPNNTTIYDSAHAVHRGDAEGFTKDLICYSFYPTKNLSGAEGGMIATNNKDHAEWLKKARWHARVGRSWDYIIEFPAWKFNMTDVQAAIAMDYLNRMDNESANKKKMVALYNKLLGTSSRSDHIFQTIVNKRNEFAAFMAEKGIECSMHFKPVHKQPAFKKYSIKLPSTEHFENLVISLPLFPSMTADNVEEICTLTKEWNSRYPVHGKEYSDFTAFLRS